MNNQGSERKDLSDPTYGAGDFWVQMVGGRLRWLASVLALAAIGLFAWLLTEGKEARIDFPIQLKGRPALWIVGVKSIVWLVIAAVNWLSWLKRKRNLR
jgi:hypothetical protein